MLGFSFSRAVQLAGCSPARDWTRALGSESAESQPLDHQRIPKNAVDNISNLHFKYSAVYIIAELYSSEYTVIDAMNKCSKLK